MTLPLSDQQREDTARLGRLAVRARLPVTDCLFNPSVTPGERVKASHWVRAHQNTDGTNAVDYT